MLENLERFWVSLINTNLFRRLVKWSFGGRFYYSKFYQNIIVLKNFLDSYIKSLTNPHAFDSVTVFCFFIGHAKSGGSLIGSILDAHENILLADEVDSLVYIQKGLDKSQIFHILETRSRKEAYKGRVTSLKMGSPYSLKVAGQFQGKSTEPLVVGDSRAGITTQRFTREPDLLDQVREVMDEVQIKLIHVVRNPFDVLSWLIIRGNLTFEEAVTRYFNNCQTLTMLHDKLQASEFFVIRYEDFVENTREKLYELCEFFGVAAEEEYLDAGANIVVQPKIKDRAKISWEEGWIDRINREIARFDFLDGYSYTSD